uniref:Uncharacterized protein n=1 Tax=Ditylenchus dipsaci TaxID=166011 RepID=A0A915E9Y4_9BILA
MPLPAVRRLTEKTPGVPAVRPSDQTDYDEDHPFPSHVGHGPAVNECKEGECPLKNQDSCTADACKDYPPRNATDIKTAWQGSAATNLAFVFH